MKLSSTCRGLLGLTLAAVAAIANADDLRALSESEMSGVYGRGLSEPAMSSLGAFSPQEQGSNAATADAFAALGNLSTEGASGLDRQLAQQQAQTATAGLQTALKLTQTLASVAKLLGPSTLTMLPTIPFPLFFALPALPALPPLQDGHKH